MEFKHDIIVLSIHKISPEVTPVFSEEVRVSQYLIFFVVLCESLFVLLSVFF